MRLPVPEWPGFAAKFVALLCSIAIILAVAMVTAILVQSFHHYYRHQIGLFIATLFGIDFSLFIFLAVLAFFIHVLSPNKYVGYFAFIGFAIVNLFIWRPLHVATNLVQFGQTPTMVYSDFFGYAPFLRAWEWFTLYWAAFCLLLVVATLVLWPRGRDTALEQPDPERATAFQRAACALLPQSDWSRSLPLAYGSTTTPRF